jgi:hypothetical protein
MFEPRNAARERANAFRAQAAKVKEQLDRTTSDLKAGREKGVYNAEAIRGLEDFVALEQLRWLQLLGLAVEYETIAAGGRAFSPMPCAALPSAKGAA